MTKWPKRVKHRKKVLARDLHYHFIGEVERGSMEISLGSLLKIANALGVRGRDLLRDL